MPASSLADRMRATRYRTVPADPQAHLFEVSCTVDDPDPAGQAFRLPARTPGSYLIREFARNFVSVRAECAGAHDGARRCRASGLRALSHGELPGKDPPPRVWLGATVAQGADVRLKQLVADGPAARAGLASGDTVVAIDGLRATPERLDRLAGIGSAGDVVELQAFRRDELMKFAVTLAMAPADTCWLTLIESAAPEVAARRDAWLGISATTCANAAESSSRDTAAPRSAPSTA